MRSKKVALYAVFDSLNQISRSVLSIYVRRVFILTLGNGLMGLNGLFSSILSLLSLAELGFGSVIAVCLYQSIAENNRTVISAYMRMLKKIYWFTGTFILAGGLAVFPIVQKMINGEYNQIVVLAGYVLHLLATAVSYFFSYRTTLLHANQEGYIVSRTNLIMYTLSLIAQIIVLLWKKSYFGFLICTILQNLISGIWLTRYVNKKYDYIVQNEKESILPSEEKKFFMDKFKAMFIYKISDYLIQGADNIIISVAIGTIVVGYYNNYNLIVNMCWAIFSSIAVGAVAAIGNMIYTEQEKIKETLSRLLLLQQLVFCASTTGIFQLSTLFVTSFLSKDSLLPTGFVAMISMYYYVRGITYPLESVRMGAGVYENDQWKQLGLAVLNVIISILGCIAFGIQGVVLGTFVCYFVRGGILTPKQIFGNIIEKEYQGEYYTTIFKYSFVTFAINYIMYKCLRGVQLQNVVIEFAIKGIACVAVTLIVNMSLFRRTKEFKYLVNTIENILLKRKS